MCIRDRTVVLRDGEYTDQTAMGVDNKTVGEKYMGMKEEVGTLTHISYDEDKDCLLYTSGSNSDAKKMIPSVFCSSASFNNCGRPSRLILVTVMV